MEDIVHIAITNRAVAEKVSAPIKTPYAILSITDPDSDLPNFPPNENRFGIHFLQFYDLVDINDQLETKDAEEYILECIQRFFK